MHNQARAAGISGDGSPVTRKPLFQLEVEGCVPASWKLRWQGRQGPLFLIALPPLLPAGVS